jgi:tetratricopeptide (TPR) repeat protein
MKTTGRYIITVLLFTMLSSLVSFSQTAVYQALLHSGALKKRGEIESAIRIIDEALSVKSDYRLLLERGEIHLSAGNLAGAENDFTAASRLYESSGSFGLARIYASRKDAARSLAFLEKNLSSPLKVSERRIFSDNFLHSIDNTTEWRRFWATDRYSDNERLLAEVEYLTGMGKGAEALALTTEKQSISGSAELILAGALASYHTGNYTSAINLLTSAAASEVPSGRKSRLLADSYLASGNFRQAMSYYSKLIDGEETDPALFIRRAECYLGLADYRRSLADIDFYLTLYPADNNALLLAGTISLSSGDPNGALTYLNRNLEANPDSREAFRSRGNVWSSIRMWEYAVSDYSMVLDLDPFDGETWLSKGISLLNMGKTDEACHDFRIALRQGNRKASEYINRSCIR